MIKKILNSLLISSMLVFFGFTAANAGASIGVSLAGGIFSASGTETEDGENNTLNNQEMATAIPEVFIEVNLDRASIGLSYVPVDYSVESQRVDSLCATCGLGAGEATIPTTQDIGVSDAKAEFTDLITLYADVPLADTGAYAKIGVRRVSVLSKENLHTGSSYGDVDLNGYIVGLGYRADAGETFFKVEATYSDFEDFELTASGNTANKIKGTELNGAEVRFAVGKSF